MLAFARRDLETAVPLVEQAVTIARESGRTADAGRYLMELGLLAASSGDFARADTHLAAALALCRKAKARHREGVVLGNWGNTFAMRGEFGEAVRLFRQAIPITRETGGRGREPLLLGNLGIVLTALGDHDAAHASYRESLALAREIGDRSQEAMVLVNMGNQALERRHHAEAAEYYRLGRDVGAELGLPILESNAAGCLGQCAAAAGDYDEADALTGTRDELGSERLANIEAAVGDTDLDHGVAMVLAELSGEPTATGAAGENPEPTTRLTLLPSIHQKKGLARD